MTPEEEYSWLNNRLDLLEMQITREKVHLAAIEAEYEQRAARMTEVFGIVHERRNSREVPSLS